MKTLFATFASMSALALAAPASVAYAGPPTFQQIDPTATTYVFALGGDYTQYFGAVDDVTGFVHAVELTLPPTAVPTSTSGCDASDFGGFTAGRIALMQRGGCTPGQKAVNAFAAGAIGALIFNEGQPGRVDAIEFSYPGFAAPIPTFNLSFALGQSLAEALGEGSVRVRMVTEEEYFRASPVGSVPEASTWALLMAGFGLAGVGLRRRRAAAATLKAHP